MPVLEEIDALLNSLSNACGRVNSRVSETADLSVPIVQGLAYDLAEIARIESALEAKAPRPVSPKRVQDGNGIIHPEGEVDDQATYWGDLYNDSDKNYEPRTIPTLYVSVAFCLVRSTENVSASDLPPLLEPLCEDVLFKAERIKTVLAEAFVYWFLDLKKKMPVTQSYRKKLNVLAKSWYLFHLSQRFSNAAVSLKREHENLNKFQLWVSSIPSGLISLTDNIQLDLKARFATFELMMLVTGAMAILAGVSDGVMIGLSLTHTVNGLVAPIIGVGVLLLLLAAACAVFARYSYTRDAKRILPKDFAERLRDCDSSIFEKAQRSPVTENELRSLFGLQEQ